MNMRSLLAGVCALSLAFPALAQQTVVGGPGVAPSSGGATSPGGSTTQLQYNNAGAFGGISTLTNVAGVITNSASATGAVEQLTGTYTASTTSAFFYIDPAATASSAFNASGTLLGINGASGFTGNAIDVQLNGASKFKINGQTGAVTVGAGVNAQGYSNNGAVIIALSKPTASGTGIGTSPPASIGASSAGFTQAVGTGPTNSTFILTFATAATNGYICQGQDLTANGTVIAQTAVTLNTVSTFQAYTRAGVTTSLTAADVLAFQCIAY
jgi:hypothetical protein